MVWCGVGGWKVITVSALSLSLRYIERNSDREGFTIMINQIGMLQEQGNTCKDLDWGAFRILKTDWLSLPYWLTEKSLTDWQKSDWLTDWLTKCLTVLLTEWLTGKSLTDWLTDKSLTDWLMDAVLKNKMQNLGVLFRLTNWQKSDWLANWLSDLLTDWLTDWLTKVWMTC